MSDMELRDGRGEVVLRIEGDEERSALVASGGICEPTGPLRLDLDTQADEAMARFSEGVISEDEARARLREHLGLPPEQARWDAFARAEEPEPWWRSLARRLGRSR